MTSEEIEKQVRAYESARTQHSLFAQALKALLAQLLVAKNIEVVNIEVRTKTVESFRGKIEREDKNYSDPINQITDLAGLRIITYQLADIDSVSEVIKNNLKIDTANSVDKRQSLEADRFGYASVHYVVSLEANRAGLPEYVAFTQLRGEIQVRTALQHAWAAIDHKLRYKSKEEIPKDLRRQLYRISALLETADEEFESLRGRIDKVRAVYSEAVASDSLDIPLDVDSLSVYIEGNAHAKALLAASQAVQISIAPHHPNAKLPEYSHLLAFLEYAEVRTIQGFDKVIAAFLPKAENVLSKIVGHWHSNVSMPNLRLVMTRDSLFRLAFLLALPPNKANGVVSKLRFRAALGVAVEKAYKEVHNAPDFTIVIQQDVPVFEPIVEDSGQARLTHEELQLHSG